MTQSIKTFAHSRTHTSSIDTELFFNLTIFRIEIKFISTRNVKKNLAICFRRLRVSPWLLHSKTFPDPRVCVCVCFFSVWLFVCLRFFGVHFGVVLRGYVITNIIGQKFYRFFMGEEKKLQSQKKWQLNLTYLNFRFFFSLQAKNTCLPMSFEFKRIVSCDYYRCWFLSLSLSSKSWNMRIDFFLVLWIFCVTFIEIIRNEKLIY